MLNATKATLHLFVCAFVLYGITAAYEIPQATLELTGNGFTVSIPDETGIKKVAYVMEVNSEPLPLIDLINESSNNNWKYTSTTRQLKSTDQVSLVITVQHNDDVYVVMECLQVDNAAAGQRYTFEKCHTKEQTPSGAVPGVGTIPTANCERAQMTEVYNKLPSCLNELIFQDEFDSNEFDNTKWTVEDPLPLDDRSIDYEFVMYDKENVNIQDGKLVISPKILSDYVPHQSSSERLLNAYGRCKSTYVRQCKNVRPIISGRITTKDNGFYFRYGRIEIRAKFPIGDWLYPLLILEPINGFKKYDLGQMRVGITSGNKNLNANNDPIDASTLYGGVVLDTNNFHQYMKSKRLNKPLGDDFHTYTLIWERDRIIMQLDGVEYGRIESVFVQPRSNRRVHPFNQQFFLTIGLAAGGFSMFPYNTNPPTPWGYRNPKAVNEFYEDRSNWNSTWTSPNLEVDYVRVYAI